MTLEGRLVLVVGLGTSGWAAARALLQRGAKVRVTEAGDSPVLVERARVLERDGAEVEIGGHDLERLDADLAVVSPGIPPSSDVMRALEHAAMPVISEIELAYRLAECDILAVTGTNGKTTTTALLGEMLNEGGIESVAAGNIGVPLIEAILQVGKGGAIAAEVSSFQLAGIELFHPRVAVLLNVAEDHTDWHGSMDAYAEAKARVVANQTPDDYFVVNRDDDGAWALRGAGRGRIVPVSTVSAPTDGIGVDGDHVAWKGKHLMPRREIPLRGRAGTEDALAAAGAALTYGIAPDRVAAAIRSFAPLRHRMEEVDVVDDVVYIDDSKATNPHATLAAVDGLHDVVLIAGGRSKGIDLTELRAAAPPVIAVVALGEAASQIADVFEGVVAVDVAASMDDAVTLARARSVPGGSVLLAPGCASLDMYESYAARGDDFARAVRTMAERS